MLFLSGAGGREREEIKDEKSGGGEGGIERGGGGRKGTGRGEGERGTNQKEKGSQRKRQRGTKPLCLTPGSLVNHKLLRVWGLRLASLPLSLPLS